MSNLKVKEEAATSLNCAIDRNALLKVLGHVQSVVERRNTIPILGNVKLVASGGELSVTATDMDIAVVDKSPAGADGEGAATAPAHTFYDIVRKLPDGAEVSLTSNPEKGQMIIKAGKSRFTLSCLPAEDFPEMEGGEFSHEFSLSAVDTATLLDKSRFAMSTEETRYYLNGIYFHTIDEGEESVLRAVATDGHRLARIQVPLPKGAAGMPGVIVPRKTVAELKKLLDEAPEEVKVSVSESKIRFVCGNAVLISKLIDGNFPDYDRVIPEGNDKVAEMNADDFAEAVDRVATISAEKTRGVRLSLENGALKLTASSPEHGTAQEELEVQYSAEPIEIGFNSRYLLDVMQQIEGEAVQFVLADSSSPALIRDTGDLGALYVVMPMRV